ncbi:GntR family transcriptional regulator [Paraconexibacter antarcticus]|uniref:GntR family transcriptional regulator n=1 Tax=Paraconexibacter antarcticus TaxID=2949664 RepID=A0ABY5DU19_9ACTN|nr:GntR family transcriptional regulator [Paraconexibacter antarcticus]UTI64044.1 GntR family transcriptional regulator [Paraconexibacter antarcticus]
MPVPEERLGSKRELLRDAAYVRLCAAIVDGTLEPGEHLHDPELCAWLGLSRTPVREALHRLADEGLVESSPQRYTRVTEITGPAAHDAFPMLAAVHGLATELAVPHLTARDVTTLESAQEAFLAALHAQDGPRAFAADDRFHGVFVARADNAYVVRALERLDPTVHRMERLALRTLPGGRSVAQHTAIIERARAGNAAAAASAARANWLTLGALVEQSLAPPAAN